MRSMQARPMVALIAVAMLLLVTLLLPADRSIAWADSDDYEIQEIEKVKRGEKDLVIRGDVEESGLICKLKIKYADGDVDTVGEDASDKKGICAVKFDVADRKSVIGLATAKLTVETQTGVERGKATRNFMIRGRRGD